MSFQKWFYRNIYLHTDHWHKIHRLVGERADWTCQVERCKEEGHNLHAHHTNYKHLWFEQFFLSSMIYMCPYHHRATHNNFHLILKDGRELKPFHY